jgi:hypothetical protein
MNIVSQRLESDLDCWTHTEWRPDGEDPLGWAVERVWDFDGMAAMPRERVFPNGLVELILQLDDRYLDVHETGTMLTPAACVTGVYSKALLVEVPPTLPGDGRVLPPDGRLGSAGTSVVGVGRPDGRPG